MLIVFEFDEKLLGDLENDINSFVNKIIDISKVPLKFSSHLNIELAKRFGVTKRELSVQVVEDYIRKLAFKAKIEVFCFSKDQIEKESELIEKFRVGRIILLK